MASQRSQLTHTLMKVLIFLNQSAKTITKQKTIRNHQFLAAFAELLVIVLEGIKNHTEVGTAVTKGLVIN